MGGALLSGLIEGYAGQKLKQADMQHAEEQANKKTRVEYLKAAIGSGQLTPDAMSAAIDELGEITGGGGGGKKGKGGGGGLDMLKKLAGHVAQQQMPTPFEQKVQGEGGSRERSLGDVPQPERGAAQTTQALTGSLGQTPTPPQRKVFKTAQDEQDEKIAGAKRMQQEVTGPAEKERLDAEQKREETRLKSEEERQAARDKDAKDRAEATQHALDVRTKNAQAFQERMERLREAAAMDRERLRDVQMFKLSDVKASQGLEKVAMTDRAKNISETLKGLQAQITQATGLLKSREAEAQKQSWYQFWKDSPDTKSAQEDIANAQAAFTFLTDHKTSVIQGKEDMDDITAKTEDILRNGQPEWSRGAWAAANPGKDPEKASIAATKQGLKVVP
jgi:hypothetical protein